MKNSSFIVIQDRINKILKSITIDDFYFGELKLRIIKEFDLPEDYNEFLNKYGEVFLSLQKVEQENREKINSYQSSIGLLKKQEEDILKEIEEFHAKIKEQKDELNSVPTKINDKKEEIGKLESEISIVKSLANKEPYITQFQKLNSNKNSLEEWINRSPELESQISDFISQLKKQLEVKESDLESLKRKISNEEDLLEEFLNIAPYQFDPTSEAEAVKAICQYVYKKNIEYKIDVHQEYNSEFKRYVATGLKNLVITSNTNPIPIPASFIQNQNIDFKKNWRDTLLKLFNEPPDFSKVSSVNYCESFPNWNFEIFTSPIQVDHFAAIWMSLQNALQHKPGLMTKDGKLYLWVTNAIFAEIFIRKQNNNRRFLGLFTKFDNQYKTYHSESVDNKIVGGYTSSGFYIPFGIYIIARKISVEIYFHQNALLQETNSNILTDNILSSAKILEDELRDDDND